MVVRPVQSLKNGLSIMANRKIVQGCGHLFLHNGVPLATARRRFEKINKLSTLAPGVDVTQGRFAGVNADILKPQGNDSGRATFDKTILYCHGGAFCMGSPVTHRDLTAWLAKLLKARLVVPAYRLAPENPYPAAHDDIYRVYLAMLENGISASDIVFGGDSAGGNLALTLLVRLKKEGLPLPMGAFLYSPWVDLSCRNDSYVTHQARDPMMKTSWLKAMAGHFCADMGIDHPDVSPIHSDLSGLPPIQIQAGNDEILLDDALLLEKHLTRHGNRVDIRIWETLWHVFQVHASHLPAAKESIASTREFMAGL